MAIKTKQLRVLAFGALASLVGVFAGNALNCNSLNSARAGELADAIGRLANQSDGRVKELLRERLATLREIADAISQTATSAEAYRAKLAVLYAELELCETDDDRLAAHEKIVAAATLREKQVKETAGVAPAIMLHWAKLGRVDAELGLERFKAARGSRPK